jgi:hypothetical protein
MAVQRSRAVTGSRLGLRFGPLAVVGALLGGAALLAGCGGGTGLAQRGLPGDAATGTPTGVPTPDPSASGSTPAASTDPRSAAELLQAARAAFDAAPSVHVTGTAVRGGDSYVVDLRLKGQAGGTATIRTSRGTVDVVRIGDVAWVGGDLAFWQGVTGDAARARRSVGSYVKVPARQGNFGEYVAFTWPDAVSALLPDPAKPATVRPTTTIAGRAAVPVRTGEGATLSVVATGTAYPLRLDGLSDGQFVLLDFAGYGDPVPLAAPDAGTVVPGAPSQGS